jgi:DNA-binding transcriptional ArsR family regulator
MEISAAVAALGALAQESRLKVFRLLVRAGPAGMAAGEIARELAVPANTMSAHLSVLARTNLVTARKEGRSVIYAPRHTECLRQADRLGTGRLLRMSNKMREELP